MDLVERTQKMTELLREWTDLAAEHLVESKDNTLHLIHSLTTSDGRKLLLKTCSGDTIEICAPV